MTTPDITQQAREMETRLRDMLITEHSGSLVSPAESRVAYIEQQLRQREEATWEAARNIADQKADAYLREAERCERRDFDIEAGQQRHKATGIKVVAYLYREKIAALNQEEDKPNE